ncbi:MAG TPA: MFS transporter [Candidatus Mediterraneibacter norfolkensis]|nr:MFS transporter [Candidatus Mediterraneibacter norfolkensis]
MVILSLICFFSTKERVRSDESKKMEGTEGIKGKETNPIEAFKALVTNRYWVIMFFTNFVIFFVVIMISVGNVYYCQYIYGNMEWYSWMANGMSVAQFAIMFITPLLMKKIGKANIYKLGVGFMVVGFLGFSIFADSLPTIVFFNAVKGIGFGMSGAMAMGMIADTITYSRLKSGIDPVGMGNAAISASQKLGLGLGTAVLGWVMAAAGFDANLDLQGLAQPASVITAIEFLYNWLPVIMCGIAFIALILLYDIEKKLPEMEREKE